MALFRLEREADGEKAQRHVASLLNSKRYTNVTGTVGVTVTPQLSPEFRTFFIYIACFSRVSNMSKNV